jgi:hypothetical protein
MSHLNKALFVFNPCYNHSMERRKRMISKTFKKVKIQAQEPDVNYWLTQPYEERLEALEQLRQEYIGWKYGAQPGFQRVLSIIKQQ